MKPILAPRAAMRTSIGNVIVMPTPTAPPLMAAIDGFRQEKMASTKPRRRGAPPCPPRLPKTPAPCARRIETLRAARNIRAGAEGATGAGDDHGAHIVVGVGATEGVLDLRAHRACIGVELVRPVERQHHEAPSISQEICS